MECNSLIGTRDAYEESVIHVDGNKSDAFMYEDMFRYMNCDLLTNPVIAYMA